MSEKKQHVLVVCGYGCHLDTPLRPYLDRVVNFIKNEQPDTVIFCGGYTQKKTAPGVSEAELMHKYLTDNRLSAVKMPRTFVETNSYTTLENIRKASDIMYTLLWAQKYKVTIFCEATRAANVVMLARHFMDKKDKLVDSIDDITVETASWERADPFKQVKNLIYNKLAISYPLFGLAERERQKRLKLSQEI